MMTSMSATVTTIERVGVLKRPIRAKPSGSRRSRAMASG